MKFGAISDLHVLNHALHGGVVKAGLNVRARECLQTLETALRALRHHHVFVLGDIFDRVRPEPQLLEATRQVLRTPGPESVTLLVGNHDRVSFEPSDHALGPLAWPDEIQVVETPRVLRYGEGPQQHEVLCVPHVAGCFQEVLEAVVKSNFSRPACGKRLLLFHAGIYDKTFPAWAQESKGAVSEPWLRRLCQQHDITRVWAGDWHGRHVWAKDGLTIEQVGSLIPHHWGDAGSDFGYITTFDTAGGTGGHAAQIAGPRFFDGAEHLGRAVELAPTHPIYYRETVEPERIAERLRAVQAVSSGLFRAVEILPAKADTKSLTARAQTGTDVETAVRRAAEQHGKELEGRVVETALRYLGAS